MHVLQIPSWFPRTDNPFHGDFIYDFFQSLIRYGGGDIQYGAILAESYQYYYKNLINLSSAFTLSDKIRVISNKGKFLPVSSNVGLWAYQQQIRQLYKEYVRQHGTPDLIHAHIYPAALAATSLTVVIPIVYTEQSSALLSKKKGDEKVLGRIRRAAEKTDCTVAISSKMEEALRPHANRLIRFFNPVETDEFVLHHDKNNDVFRWVATGFLLKHKGFQDVLEAFRILLRTKTSYSSIELHIIGDGPEESNLKQLVKLLELSENVFFHGSKSKDYIAKKLGSYHAFVMGSHYEPFGIVVPEALSCGLPVVATSSGGPDDVITDPSLGRIVEPGNIEQMAENMIEVVNNYENFDPTHIREYTIKNYSQKCFVERMEGLYQSMIVK